MCCSLNGMAVFDLVAEVVTSVLHPLFVVLVRWISMSAPWLGLVVARRGCYDFPLVGGYI